MKISDNGFSERISTPSTRTQSTEGSRGASSNSSTGRGGSTADTLQLSSFASRLQSSSTVDSSRGARVAAIAKAVQSNSFQVNPLQISRAMVSEAVGSQTG